MKKAETIAEESKKSEKREIIIKDEEDAEGKETN